MLGERDVCPGVNGTEGRNPQGRTPPSPREPGVARVLSAPLSSVLTFVFLTSTLLQRLAAMPVHTAAGCKFVCPLGVGAHLEHWGIAPDRIVELDWWETATVATAPPAGHPDAPAAAAAAASSTLELTATPARHSSGRIGIDKCGSLWAGWAIHSPASDRRVYFSGDSAYHRHFGQ